MQNPQRVTWTSAVAVMALWSCSSATSPLDMTGRDGAGDVGNPEVRLGPDAGDAGMDAATSPDDVASDAAKVDSSPVNTQPLCDGIPHLRLWVLVEPMNSRELPGSAVRIENGAPFLVVDGTCAFWIAGGWKDDPLGRDREIRRGMLAPSDARSLEQAIFFQEVPGLADCPLPGGASDVSVRAIRTANGYARCPSAGARFDAAWSVVQTLADALWESGTPMDDGLHVSAVVAGDGPPLGRPPYPWSAGMPLASLLLVPGKDGMNLYKSGVSHAVNEAAAVENLRSLRALYLTDRAAQPGMFTSWDGLKVSDGDTVAFLYMRDAIPYEDAFGLLQL